MNENIGYHTRLYTDNSQKVVGGSFGGRIDSETVERLTKAHFSVAIKPSGTVVFVDKQGREVWLYLTVDAGSTTQGRALAVQHRKTVEAAQEQQRVRIDELLDSLSPEEIIARLS